VIKINARRGPEDMMASNCRMTGGSHVDPIRTEP
jgi:hypothetical protein